MPFPRSSVMPKSMKECSEKRPELDQDLILLDIGKITTQVELGCTSGGDLFAPDQVKYYSEVSEYGIQGTFGVCLGLDRASLSLYTPLEGLETTFAIFSNAVMDFGDRARLVSECSIPSLAKILTCSQLHGTKIHPLY